MSRSADARAEVALLEALGQGPLDVLDLVQALRKDAGWVLKGGEGVVHVLLHRLVRTQRVVVGPPGRRGLATYAAAVTAPDAEMPPPPENRGDLPVVDRRAADEARRLAKVVRDPATRGRIQADATAHLDQLARVEHPQAFGRTASWASLLQRVDRGRAAVVVVAEPGDFFRRFLLHDGLWLAGIVIAFFVVRAFVLEVFHIPSTSMEPTLLVGDRVAVRKIGGQPKRWDIVTFELNGITYVKRMVGMPGESFGIRNGDLYADGQRLVKPYELSQALRKPVARWDFGAADGARGPGVQWRRVAADGGVTWLREAAPFQPDGSLLGERGEYRYGLRDGWLVVSGQIDGDGSLRAVYARMPFGYEGSDPAARLEVEAGSRGTHLLLRRRDESGAWLEPEVLLANPAWRLAGAARLELGVVDGVVHLALGGRTWSQAVSLPDEPVRIEVGTRGPGARLGEVALDADQHWSHQHQYAVPGPPGPDGRLPPLATYAFPIPDDAFFALGDNTLNSDDSRTVAKGAIPLANLTGPVVFRVWPLSRIGVPD
ncbi:MAG: signal peptidase I [Planctomycetes bacterium]|nr:signal peptidase I [Planctomycetota bacterium]MCB9828841.1 signal peptidase I [Planctomycetota bacterium]